MTNSPEDPSENNDSDKSQTDTSGAAAGGRPPTAEPLDTHRPGMPEQPGDANPPGVVNPDD